MRERDTRAPLEVQALKSLAPTLDSPTTPGGQAVHQNITGEGRGGVTVGVSSTLAGMMMSLGGFQAFP